MIPLRRAFDEKRRLILPLAIAIVLNIVVVAAVVYPLGARVRTGEARALVAEQQLAAASRENTAARNVVQGKISTDTALKSFYGDVLPTTLASARNITYLHLEQLAEQHNLRSSGRRFEAEENPKGALRRLRISMALTGNYQDVRRFIYDLESGSDFIVIDSVSLAEGGETGGQLQLTLELSTYYKHGA